jgi:hypothetical protein
MESSHLLKLILFKSASFMAPFLYILLVCLRRYLQLFGSDQNKHNYQAIGNR